jgi:putative molybdopterin biosynthesis protein
VERQEREPSLQNHLRAVRQTRGLSQGQLANLAGLTRQTISALEKGHYVPNTVASLKLAQALECRVEDLFHLEDTAVERQVHLVAANATSTRRLVLAQVGERLVAHPLSEDRAIQEGFASADAILIEPQQGGIARLLVPGRCLESTALVLGCDPSLGAVCEHLSRWSWNVRLTWLTASSRSALHAVSQRDAHLAGSHLRDPGGNEFNISHAHSALSPYGGLVVAFAAWEQGFVVAPGNPKKILGVSDLARHDVRLVNREEGAGCRNVVDEMLHAEGVSADRVRGYDYIVASHLAVARAVAAGAADVGLALRASAHMFNLGFIPISDVRFDFIIPRWSLEHPAVKVLLEILQSRSLREEVATLPGYDVSRMGTVIADIPAA